MNKPRLKARTQITLLDNAHFAILATAVFGTFFGLTALFGHSHNPIAVLTTVIAAFAAGTLTNTFLGEAIADRRERLTKTSSKPAE